MLEGLTPDQRMRAEAIRSAQERVVPYVMDKPAAINAIVISLKEWASGTYSVGDVRQHEGVPYRCVQGHDSTDNPGWTPEATPALWMQYHGTSAATARPYLQPQGAHDAYQAGEYATEGGTVYRCKIDNTVYPPSGLLGSWEAVGGVEEPGEPEPETPPVNEWPTWVQPTGGHDAYVNGAQVTHAGKRWVSTADGNVWEPGVYGWTQAT